MTLAMFDIDGTLTETVRADDACFVEALGQVFGFREVDTDWAGYPHATDSGIIAELSCRRRGRPPQAEELADFQECFLSLLQAAAAEEPFVEVTGARALMARLRESDGFAVAIATGGWKCTAEFKLATAGFDARALPAAFANDAHARQDIMRASLARAAQAYAVDGFTTMIYVGDGVWDARAAKQLGWRFIGIAREEERRQRLNAEGVRNVFPDYRDAEDWLKLLREP